MPASVPDRSGWAVDIHAALSALEVEPGVQNVCAVLAVTEQESGYRADPPVQVSIALSERQARERGYPCPVGGSIRQEVIAAAAGSPGPRPPQ